MNYSKIDPMSIVDGEGLRVSLFVSGCRNHCKGCFNPDTWDFNYGQPFTQIEMDEFIYACNRKYIAGGSLLGGDPMEPENQIVIVDLVRRFRKECVNKTLWLYTGYILERDLVCGGRIYIPGVTDYILRNIDILVDGPFVMAKRDLTLRFRGSSNQRLIAKDFICSILEQAEK
jgi:anaerobic ribonucleoside-triphosphate reductase activating protein